MTDPSGAFDGRRAVVTGASGFIGRWVVRALAERGAHVLAVGRDRVAVETALRDARGQIEIIESDLELMTPGWITPLAPDVVFNLAGYGVDRTERDETTAWRINHYVVQALAIETSTLGGDWPHARLVHTGSALEYGMTAGDLREDSPASPTTLYGKTKLGATRELARLGQTSGLRAIVARLFTVYGPGEHAGRLLPTILAAARHNEPIPLTDGTQRRDFAYVEDVVEGLLRLAVSDAAPGEVVNLASGVMQSVRTFVERAADAAGIDRDRLQFGALPTRPEEMEHSGVSVAKLQRLTGWTPSADIVAGVRRTIYHLGVRG
ncbi:MAG TPA: NAD-dependent epimerase/dehydratase family protein [Gemmatimonadaceae bacterium]|nr:NAD-dependent epimerase/dehydratase family protein [Gemmatimonadaceae bacterium]